MRRRAHFLKTNRSRQQPHSVVYLDTETWPDERGGGRILHRLRFGWACYERTRTARHFTAPEWFRFTRAEDLWAWIEHRARAHTRTYIFAHNWSFDACVVDAFRILPERGWTLSRAIIEAPPVILVWRKEGRSLELLDTLNWWRTSLASLATSVGLSKLPMPRLDAPSDEWDRYARQDVEILRVALHHWWAFLLSHDLGGFARTLAGQAMRSYRHRFMDHPILCDEDEEALRLARESYHGGRVECFRLGRVEGPLVCLDVNSMYPFVMRDRLYPAKLTRRIRRATPGDLERWSTRFCLVARVCVRTARNRYAVLRDGKLIFPVGRFWVSLTTPDLTDAIQHRELESVDSVALYERAPLFTRFVEELYAMRLVATHQGDSVRRYLLKILMNSLYGKFGQKGCVWENCGRDPERRVRVWREHDCEIGVTRLLRSFGGVVQEKLRDTESRESHPAIAAHVTAYAREYLWRIIGAVQRGDVLYCDTDSVIIRTRSLDSLTEYLSQEGLGGLKVEWSAPWIHLNGAKDYETPAKRVAKGVRSSAHWITSNMVRQEQWSSLPGLVWDGDLSAPVTDMITKRLRREYDKAEVLPDGTISPWTLADT